MKIYMKKILININFGEYSQSYQVITLENQFTNNKNKGNSVEQI